jgi:hypothetical protein
VTTGRGLVGDVVREVRGEVGGNLLLVLSSVGVIGLRDSLGKKGESGTISVAVR